MKAILKKILPLVKAGTKSIGYVFEVLEKVWENPKFKVVKDKLIEKTGATEIDMRLGQNLKEKVAKSQAIGEKVVDDHISLVNNIIEESVEGTSNLGSKLDNITDASGNLNQVVVDDIVDDVTDMANKGELSPDTANDVLDKLEGQNNPDLADEILDVQEAAETLMNGDQYTKVNRLKTLKADVSYTTPGGHLYNTDSLGRIDSVSGDLTLTTAKRNSYAQRVAGRGDRIPSTSADPDHGGHLIASIFNGSGDLDNLVPMNGNLNQGAWKSMENEWKAALGLKQKVTVNIDVIYDGVSQRPTDFVVEYFIGETKHKKIFENIAGGGL